MDNRQQSSFSKDNKDRNASKAVPYNKKYKPFRKKYCKFCSEGVVWIDYKNVEKIEQYITDRGKIVSAKITGTCSKHQRQLSTSIKILRQLALLPYTTVNYKSKSRIRLK